MLSNMAKTRVPRFEQFKPSSPAASRAMSGNRSKKTQPELLLRRAVWKLGLRYRVNVPFLPGKPDLAFLREKVAVFCDGDFWHGRDWEARKARLERGRNAAYWTAKIQRNIERDEAQTAMLEELGWTVLRLWETDIRKDPDAAAREVRRAVQQARKKAR